MISFSGGIDWMEPANHLDKDDADDGSENVGKKMNLRSFKLNRIYLGPVVAKTKTPEN